MGNKGLFPGVAVPLAFFCTLFFRHRKKSVSAPWDGKSQSAPESARQAPPRGFAYSKVVAYKLLAGGFPLAPCTPSGSRRAHGSMVCACGRTKGLSSGQTIGAVRTAVRPACCLPERPVAIRLRRLYLLDTRFPTFPPAPPSGRTRRIKPRSDHSSSSTPAIPCPAQ